jgi:hypothetical protein
MAKWKSIDGVWIPDDEAARELPLADAARLHAKTFPGSLPEEPKPAKKPKKLEAKKEDKPNA